MTDADKIIDGKLEMLGASCEQAINDGNADESFLTALRLAYEEIIAALRRSEPERSICPLCKGTGQRDVMSFVDPTKTIKNSCSVCKGSGILLSERQPSSDKVLVPREPTLAMAHAFLDEAVSGILNPDGTVFKRAYASMLRAAAEADGHHE